MATLTQRITELAGAVRDKFNQIMPRLLPPGGTAGQALVKASNADNSVLWSDIAGGSNYTLATDPSPSLSAPLQTNRNAVVGRIDTSNTAQWIKAVPATTTVSAFLSLGVRNAADTATLAGITINGSGSSGGYIYFDGYQMQFRDASANPIYTFPRSNGSAGQFLTANGSALSAMTWTTPTKSVVGLGNVDNTSDLSKPISTATQNALNTMTLRLVPTGGSAGQVLVKASNADNSVVWTTPPASVGFYAGGLLNAAEVIGRVHAAQAFTIDAANCKVTSDTASTASAVITIKKDGTAIGTATFAAGATTATVAITTTAIAKGDLITFHAPDTQDATLANVSGTITN